MKKCILTYGLMAGSISIVLGLLNWFTVAQAYGVTVSRTIGYLSIILALLCIPLGIRYYRDRLNNGRITFGEAFRIGIGITFITSFMIFLYSVLFFVFAGSTYDEWTRKGLSEAELNELQARVAQAPDFVFTPWFQAFILFLTVFLIGVIIDFISAMTLCREAGLQSLNE